MDINSVPGSIGLCLKVLRPNSSFTVYNNSVSGINWNSSNLTSCPTEDEINKCWNNIYLCDKINDIRRNRDYLLYNTDYINFNDTNMYENERTYLQIYRQQLRDLPQIYSNLNNNYEIDTNYPLYLNKDLSFNIFNKKTCKETLGNYTCFVNDLSNSLITNIDNYKNLIVSSTGNYIYDLSYTICVNNEALNNENYINEVKLSYQDNDKKCFGVIDTSCNNKLKIKNIGKGTLWVTNKNGNLSNGDYIASCSIPGYGMKQAAAIQKNYTVAKITCDIDFSNIQINKQKPLVNTQIKNIFIYDISNVYCNYNKFIISYDNSLNKYKKEFVNYTKNKTLNFIAKQEVNLYDASFENIIDFSHNVPKIESINIEEINLDNSYNVVWNNVLDNTNNNILENKFQIRYLLENGNIITQEEYNTRLSNNENVYIACLVGCIYKIG